ncbi:MAG: LytTR family transcriptional regulator [Spirochaetes bacterium]|nr:LytTR family transcriptional regulator [Spirochaetota bacterium]
MFRKFPDIKLFFKWTLIYIAITVIIFISKSPAPDSGNLSSLIKLLLNIFVVGSFSTLAGYCSIRYMHEKSGIIKIPVILSLSSISGLLGNFIIHYLAQLLLKEKPHWTISHNLDYILIFATVIGLVMIKFDTLNNKKTELERRLDRINENSREHKEFRTITVKDDEGYHAIKFGDLIYLSSHGKKCAFHTSENIYTVNQLLKDFKDKLPSDIFLRVHKQFIINIKYLKQIRYYEGGRYTAYLDDEDESIIPVGRNVAPVLKEKFKI